MASGSGAIRAGRAFVELFTDSNALYRGLDAAKRRLQSWGAGVAKLGAGIGLTGGGVFAPVAKLAGNAAAYGSDIKGLSASLGVTAEEASGLRGAFEAAGVAGDEFKGIMDGLQSKVSAAADANGELIDGIQGLRGLALVGKPITEVLDQIFDKFAGFKNAADVVDRANGLGLGKLIPYLLEGREGLARLKEEGKGAIISPEQAEAGAAAQKSLNAAWMAGKYALLDLGSAILPSKGELKEIVGTVRTVVGGFREWVAANRDAIAAAVKVAAVVATVGAGLVAVGAVATGAGAVLGAIAAAFKLAAGAAFLLVSPVGLVAAAVAGLGYLFVTQTEAGRELFDSLKAGFAEAADTAKTALGSIVQSLKIGDIGGAIRTGLAGVNLEWAKAVAYWTRVWVDFKTFFVEGWRDAVMLTKLALISLTEFIGSTLKGVLVPLYEGLGSVAKTLGLDELAGTLGEVAKFYADIERNAEKARQGIFDDRNKQAQGDAAFRKGQIDNANAAVAAAQAEFADALKAGADAVDAKAAADRTAAAEADIVAVAMGNVAAGARKLAQLRGQAGGLADAVKGSFVLASGAQQFGYGDTVAKRQLDAVEGINKNAAVLPELNANVKDLADGLRFK